MDDQHLISQAMGTASVEAMSGVTPAGAGVLRQVAYLFGPLVRLLLAHGITYQRVSETLKGVFIEEAQRGADKRAGRLTDSYLAVTTGIHRKDIRRLLGAKAQTQSGADRNAPQGLPAAVFTRWLTDPAYCDAVGQPKLLLRYGEHGFEEMVKTVSTDVHPRTVLNELIRLDLANLEGDSVHLKVNSFVPNPDFSQMLQYMGANLHDHAAAAVQNVLESGPALLEQSIYSEAIPAAAIKQLEALARDQWMQILKKVVPEVARLETDKSDDGSTAEQDGRPRVRMRLGMYFYTEEHNPNT